MQFNISLLDFLSSKIQVKIVRFLLTHEAAMSEREIASILKISHMTINRTMQKLININLVNFVTIGKAHTWKVNQKSYAYKVFSELFVTISETNTPLQDLKRIILKTLHKSLVKKVILFGSVANKTEKANSDIDLFILVDSVNNKKKVENSIEALSTICLNMYGNRLSAYILTKRELQNKKNLAVISEIKNGIQLFP